MENVMAKILNGLAHDLRNGTLEIQDCLKTIERKIGSIRNELFDIERKAKHMRSQVESTQEQIEGAQANINQAATPKKKDAQD